MEEPSKINIQETQPVNYFLVVKKYVILMVLCVLATNIFGFIIPLNEQLFAWNLKYGILGYSSWGISFIIFLTLLPDIKRIGMSSYWYLLLPVIIMPYEGTIFFLLVFIAKASYERKQLT